MSDRTLEIKGVVKRFKKKQALDYLDLTFHEGICGLLGPNGAGKSTLMRCIADLYRPDEGTILYNGEDIYRMGDTFRGLLSYLPQDQGYYSGYTCMDMMRYFTVLKKGSETDQELEAYLEQVHLLEEANKKVKTLSGGMKRRLGIALTLVGNPQVMLFDEPTAGLDPAERLRFKNIIRSIKGNRIIIISTHIISDLEEISDEIIFIKNGKNSGILGKAAIDANKGKIEEMYANLYESEEKGGEADGTD